MTVSWKAPCASRHPTVATESGARAATSRGMGRRGYQRSRQRPRQACLFSRAAAPASGYPRTVVPSSAKSALDAAVVAAPIVAPPRLVTPGGASAEADGERLVVRDARGSIVVVYD